MHAHSDRINVATNKNGTTMLRWMAGFFLLILASASAQTIGAPASVTSIGRGVLDANLHTGGGPGATASRMRRFEGRCRLGVPPQRVVGSHPGLGRDHDGDHVRHRRPAVVYLYYPYAVPDSSLSPSTDTQQQQDSTYQSGYEQGRMAAEVQRLQKEVADLKASQPAQEIAQPSAATTSETDDSSGDTAAVLVLRDGSRVDLRNYAIVGEEVWNIQQDHTDKIPVADIDLAETTRINGQRGIELSSGIARP